MLCATCWVQRAQRAAVRRVTCPCHVLVPRPEAPVVPMHEGDHLLLYTDGVWETLADEDGRAEERFMSAIDRAVDGGAALLDTLLADVHHELAGQLQADDFTLLTASMIAATDRKRSE